MRRHVRHVRERVSERYYSVPTADERFSILLSGFAIFRAYEVRFRRQNVHGTNGIISNSRQIQSWTRGAPEKRTGPVTKFVFYPSHSPGWKQNASSLAFIDTFPTASLVRKSFGISEFGRSAFRMLGRSATFSLVRSLLRLLPLFVYGRNGRQKQMKNDGMPRTRCKKKKLYFDERRRTLMTWVTHSVVVSVTGIRIT